MLSVVNLKFDTSVAVGYKSASQVARVLTEDWLAKNMYCPICGNISISRSKNNAPVKDFVCESCHSQYELKSKRRNSDQFQSNVVDGVYKTMIERISSLDNPSFFFMHYDRYEVNNLVVVPKCFFTPSVILKRTPLSDAARRARWEGCEILLKSIPLIAKIPIISNGVARPQQEVMDQYDKVYKLQTQSVEARGWLMDILHLIERLDSTFSLQNMYAFVDELKIKYPKNNHIQEKIRQQLQFLRDNEIIEFCGRGIYRKI